jgi:hypothetical protein
MRSKAIAHFLTSAVALCVTAVPAFADQVTLACKFEGSERQGPDRETEINQIFIDTDSPAVELRIAQTMGTSKQVYFGYRNRKAKGLTDDKVLLYFVGSKMSMAAIRLGVPTSIVLDRVSGSMVWAWADQAGSRAYRFNCKALDE